MGLAPMHGHASRLASAGLVDAARRLLSLVPVWPCAVLAAAQVAALSTLAPHSRLACVLQLLSTWPLLAWLVMGELPTPRTDAAPLSSLSGIVKALWAAPITPLKRLMLVDWVLAKLVLTLRLAALPTPAAAALGTVLLSAYGRELQLVSKASLPWEGSSGPALTAMLLLLKAAQGIVAVGVGGSILPISAPWQLGSVLVKLVVVLLHTVPLLLVLLSGAVLSPSLPGRLLAISSQIHSSTSAGNCNSCSNTRLYTISKHGDSFEGAPAALSAKRLLQLSAGSTGSSNHSSKAAAKRESSSGSSSVATAGAGSIAATDLARISRLPLGRLAEFALGALHAQQPGQRLSIDSCVKQQAQGQDSEGGMALGDAALLGLHVQQMLRLALQCGELVDQALLTAEQVSGAGTAADVAATAAREQSAAATAGGARAQGAAEQGAAQLKAAVSCVDAHMQTDGDASAVAGVGSAAVAAVADGGGDSGMWHAIVDTLRQHSSEIAHDMKNPLNGVLALSQNVVQGVFGELPTNAVDQLHVVRACGYHLLNMINMTRDMLKMLGDGDPEVSLNKTSLASTVDEVLNRMKPMVGNRIQVHWTPAAVTVVADDQKLYQVVHCVVSNAFKYTRKGSVTIEVAPCADGRYVSLNVTDTGSGFSAEQLDKFRRPLVAGPHQPGLGLVMVRRLMAAFGGELRLRNRGEGGASGSGAVVEMVFKTDKSVPDLTTLPCPASGTLGVPRAATATVAAPPSSPRGPTIVPPVVPSNGTTAPPPLPTPPAVVTTKPASASAAPSMSASAPAAALTSSSSSPPADLLRMMESRSSTNVGEEVKLQAKILIVDDDPINLSILEDLLHSAGCYETVTAASGTEALEVYMTLDPPAQLVLLDVTLPDMSGHEVCHKMRTLTPGVPPPIIMISGKASTKDVIKGLQAGSCDYITKPFQPAEVLARVETQLRLFMGEVQQLQEAAERSAALLGQILPNHILDSLKAGSRVLVEKFSDVCVIYADIVNFAELTAHADTADCVLTLNQMYCTFDLVCEKYGVHKVDVIGDAYLAAVGHQKEDPATASPSTVRRVLECAREMLEVVRNLQTPPTLGKLELRLGVHVGPVFAGVVGVKFPRYSFFGTTMRLAKALTATALPMTVHISDMVYNRVKGATSDRFLAFTQSSFSGLGMVRTHLLLTSNLDVAALQTAHIGEYLSIAAQTSGGLQVIQALVGSNDSMRMSASFNNSQLPQGLLYSVYRGESESQHTRSSRDRGSTDDVPDSHRFAAGHRDHADADAALGKSSGGGSGRGTLASPGAKAAPAPAAAPPVTTLGPSVPAAGLDTESEEMPSLSHAVGLGTPQRNSPQGNIAAQRAFSAAPSYAPTPQQPQPQQHQHQRRHSNQGGPTLSAGPSPGRTASQPLVPLPPPGPTMTSGAAPVLDMRPAQALPHPPGPGSSCGSVASSASSRRPPITVSSFNFAPPMAPTTSPSMQFGAGGFSQQGGEMHVQQGYDMALLEEEEVAEPADLDASAPGMGEAGAGWPPQRQGSGMAQMRQAQTSSRFQVHGMQSPSASNSGALSGSQGPSSPRGLPPQVPTSGRGLGYPGGSLAREGPSSGAATPGSPASVGRAVMGPNSTTGAGAGAGLVLASVRSSGRVFRTSSSNSSAVSGSMPPTRVGSSGHLVALASAGSWVGPLDAPGLFVPATLSELLNHLGLGHYSKALEARGVTLQQLAAMDDVAMRSAGLITVRSRQMVMSELQRLGYATHPGRNTGGGGLDDGEAQWG